MPGAARPRTPAKIVAQFRGIRCFTQGGQRAPHKPLLLLLALARVQRDEGRWIPFGEVERPLTELLEEFGPPRATHHPDYPFWRLQNDGLWAIPDADDLEDRLSASGDVPITELRRLHGGFTEDVYAAIRADPSLGNTLAAELLEQNFPASLHEEILDTVGFPWTLQLRRRRDPHFREQILRLYERRCGVCGYDGRLGRNDLALEAAHIKWHAAGGPDTPDNGMALCSFHHVAFDRGALSMDDSLRILVSQDVNGGAEVDHFLLRFAGSEIQRPQSRAAEPSATFLEWHRQEVFRPPARG